MIMLPYLVEEDIVMSTPSEPRQDRNSYPIDTESAVETARLLAQDTFITKAMGGPLIEQSEAACSTFHDILDLACGAGGWVTEVAHLLPRAQVTGIDLSKQMVAAGRARAQAQMLTNAHFTEMNLLAPLAFPEACFDLINARHLVALMTPITWPGLLRETWRVCRPGGVIRLTESEMPITSSPAFEQLTSWALQAFQQTGRNFSSDARNFGITTRLVPLLKEAGYQNIKHKPYAIDFSWGTEPHAGFYEDFKVVFQLGKDFMVKPGLTSPEHYDQTYQQFLSEMQSENFSAVSYVLTAWGIKP